MEVHPRGKVTFPFLGPQVPFRQQRRQPGIPVFVRGQRQQAGAIQQVDAATGNKTDVQLFGFRMRPNDPGQGIAVGQCDRRITILRLP